MPRFSFQPARGIQHGIGTAGTVAQIVADVEASAFLILSAGTNTGTLFVGSSGVSTANGYPRTGGQELEMVARPKDVYVVGSAAGQVYRWIALDLN